MTTTAINKAGRRAVVYWMIRGQFITFMAEPINKTDPNVELCLQNETTQSNTYDVTEYSALKLNKFPCSDQKLVLKYSQSNALR